MPTFNLAAISTRLPHIADLISAYDGEEGTTADLPVTVDIMAIKQAAIDYTTERFDIRLEGLEPGSEEHISLMELRDELLFYMEHVITDSVATTVTVDTDIKAGLQQAYNDFRNAIASELPVTEGRCSGEGRYYLWQDTGNEEDDKLVHCKTCDGFGAVASAADSRPLLIWPEKVIF